MGGDILQGQIEFLTVGPWWPCISVSCIRIVLVFMYCVSVHYFNILPFLILLVVVEEEEEKSYLQRGDTESKW